MKGEGFIGQRDPIAVFQLNLDITDKALIIYISSIDRIQIGDVIVFTDFFNLSMDFSDGAVWDNIIHAVGQSSYQ